MGAPIQQPPQPSPPPTENVYTPSQFESVKAQFKHYLFKIIPSKLHPVFLLLHDKLDNAYHSADTRGRILVRDDLIESELYDLRRKCTNDGSNAGGHSVKIEPAAGSLVLLHFMASVNLDASAVDHNHKLYTAGAVSVAPLAYANSGAGVSLVSPRNSKGDPYLAPTGQPAYIISDVFEIMMSTGSVAVSQDSDFFMLYSFIGAAPTITEVGPTGSVFSDVS